MLIGSFQEGVVWVRSTVARSDTPSLGGAFDETTFVLFWNRFFAFFSEIPAV